MYHLVSKERLEMVKKVISKERISIVLVDLYKYDALILLNLNLQEPILVAGGPLIDEIALGILLNTKWSLFQVRALFA